MREVVHEVKSVVKDQVEGKISHIANVDTPVHLVRPTPQTAEEIEVENDQEYREVKIEVRRVNVLEVVVQIEEREQAIKMIQNLRRLGMRMNNTILQIIMLIVTIIIIIIPILSQPGNTTPTHTYVT